MSARYDVEAAEPNLGQLCERAELTRGDPANSVEMRPLSHPGLRSTGGVA
jgi:hypothetical protein